MSYGFTEIRELRGDVGNLKPQDVGSYEKVRDDVVIAFLPHATNTTKSSEKRLYKKSLVTNDGYLENLLYGEVWDDLLPNERLAIEHLYYEDAALVDESTGFYANIHAYIDAECQEKKLPAKQHLKNALWEVLHNTSFKARNELERDKAKHRRRAQATMLNSMNIPSMEIHTPDYIIEPIKQQFNDTPLEELLPDIVFPLEDNARLIAEEIQQINADVQRQLRGQKSAISESENMSEATAAFIELYISVVDDGTRKFIDKELNTLIRIGRNEEEILAHMEQVLEAYQDATIPRRMEMLANHFNGKLSEMEQRELGYTLYIWRTMDDEKVRPSHAANDGIVFAWDIPPPTGHPGEEYGCRCWAEPLIAHDEIDDPPIEEVSPLLLLPVVALRRIIVEGAERIGKATLKVFKSKPKLNDTKTWPKPPAKGKFKEGKPSRKKPGERGEKSLYDENGGEWRYFPGDDRHNPHWDYKPPGKNQEWQNIPIDDLPPLK